MMATLEKSVIEKRRNSLMLPSTSLSRMRLAGKWCRRGAWIIAVVGLAVIVYFNFFVLNNPGDQGSPGLNFNQLLNSLALALLMAIPIFFFFLILFAVGTVLDYLSTGRNPQEANDERVEIVSLPKMR